MVAWASRAARAPSQVALDANALDGMSRTRSSPESGSNGVSTDDMSDAVQATHRLQDAGAILRVHDFLNRWGLINSEVGEEAYTYGCLVGLVGRA